MRLRAAGCPRISARADGYFFHEKTTIEKEDSMKVVVAGAGLGGLVAAEKLGRLGLDVTVYEKAASLDEMRYDWHDDVNPRIFRRLSIDMPEERFKKKSWTFVSPFGEVVREFRQDEEHADYSVERRPLNKLLCDRAAEVAKIVFGAKVTAPVVQEGRVAGIIVNGEEVPADLVVDAMGVDSALRKALPRELGITERRDDEVFVAYRAFYEKDTEAPAPRYTNKAYLKHMGEAGISWAIQDNDPGLVNVLVGRLGKMTDKQLADALADLKKNNPTIGNRVMRGGIVCRIPVRYPATRMVADGYAVLEISKGAWVEAIFAKLKPETEKPRLKFEQDEKDQFDTEENEDEDLPEVEDKFDDQDDDDTFDEDKLTEESYRTTIDESPEDLELADDDVADDEY